VRERKLAHKSEREVPNGGKKTEKDANGGLEKGSDKFDT
jgi:hypothetical protein